MIDDDKDSFKCPNCNEDISFQWECHCEECDSKEEQVQ
jgi:Zn finger protein HypA/HybF involved in hydrogenase expression